MQVPSEKSIRWHARCINGSIVGKGAERGFTLIEMMIVVVIVGVLATLAVVGYRRIVQSSHVSEATGMVQNIRVAQEAYKSETQQYANVSDTPVDWYPQGATGPSYGNQWGWLGGHCTCPNGIAWSDLPLHVDGPVLFGYATKAGPSTSQPPASITFKNSSVTLQQNITTDWYVVSAGGDLDTDTGTGTLVVGASWTNQLSVINEGQ
jgi:type IV pilus assembly protein PilA